MSDKRLLFIRGHIDALNHLCADQSPTAPTSKAAALLKRKVEQNIVSEPKEEYYRAGFDVTMSMARWVTKVVAAAGASSRAKKAKSSRSRELKPR